MNAERIVEILLEDDIDPEAFLGSLPPHVLNRFRFEKGEFGVKAYLYASDGKSGFIGWIQPMGEKMWYASHTGTSDFKDMPFRKTQEEAAQDLVDFWKTLHT